MTSTAWPPAQLWTCRQARVLCRLTARCQGALGRGAKGRHKGQCALWSGRLHLSDARADSARGLGIDKLLLEGSHCKAFTWYLHSGGAVTTHAQVPACRGGLHLFGDAGATAVDLQVSPAPRYFVERRGPLARCCLRIKVPDAGPPASHGYHARLMAALP